MAGLTAVLVFGLFALWKWDASRRLATEGERLRDLEVASAPLAAAADELRAMEERKAELERRVEELHRLEAARTGPAALLEVLAGAEELGVAVHGFELSQGEARLEGEASDPAAYEEFRRAFEALPGVAEVTEIEEDGTPDDAPDEVGAASGVRRIDWRISLRGAGSAGEPPRRPPAG